MKEAETGIKNHKDRREEKREEIKRKRENRIKK